MKTYWNTPQPERNRAIAVCVLRGHTYAQVGKAFCLGRISIRYHAIRECYRILGIPWPKLTYYGIRPKLPVNLKQLKERKHYLISQLTKEVGV